MTTVTNTIKRHDPVTGKTFVAQFNGRNKTEVLGEMNAVMEYHRQQTLPPERRAIANQPVDFKCPFCKTHKEPTSRKEKIVSGIIFVTTTLIDVFKCSKCQREYTFEKLEQERESVQQQNFIAKQVERVKDGEISKEQFDGIVSQTSL